MCYRREKNILMIKYYRHILTYNIFFQARKVNDLKRKYFFRLLYFFVLIYIFRIVFTVGSFTNYERSLHRNKILRWKFFKLKSYERDFKASNNVVYGLILIRFIWGFLYFLKRYEEDRKWKSAWKIMSI